MKSWAKNLIFWTFSSLAILLVTYGAYSRLVSKAKSPSPVLNTPQQKPIEQYERYQKEQARQATPSTGTFQELSEGNRPLKSSHYSAGKNWNFFTEGFLKQDLKDFAHWFHIKHPRRDPLLISQKELFSLFQNYTTFMHSDDWGSWIESLSGNAPENFIFWKRTWHKLPAIQKQKIHLQALSAKKKHLALFSKPEIKKRTAELFIEDNSGDVEPNFPLAQESRALDLNQNKIDVTLSQSRLDRLQRILRDHSILMAIALTVIFAFLLLIFRQDSAKGKL